MGRSVAFWLPALWLTFGAPVAAQNKGLVERDGTLGSGPLEVGPGVDSLGQAASYLITPQMGEQRGGNLFHSFARFGIARDETATFTGPDGIDNVISRVTGGDESRIDGRLRSTVPGADVWLLNPSGVVFGEGAQLDVPASFHASTGDYLGFGEGDLVRFYADPARPSVLSMARPEAFGFLGETSTALLAVDRSRLTVPDGEGLELVGGDLSLSGAQLTTPGGHVGLEAQGEVRLSAASRVDVSGIVPGSISIRGGQIVIEEGSRVLAETGPSSNLDLPGHGSISVAASESLLVDGSLLSVSSSGNRDAGTIQLTGGDLRFRNGPGANAFPTSVGAAADTLRRGAGGTIDIDAESLEVTEGARLSAETIGASGTAGKVGGRLVVRVPSGSVRIASGGSLQVNSWSSPGNAGAIDIKADSLTLDALDPRSGQRVETRITAWAFASGETPASGGTIDIEARSVELVNGSAGGDIGTQCLRCSGRAGAITINATEEMRLDGRIFASTFFPGTSGDGGNIEIHAGSLEIAPGGNVFSGTGPDTSGDAGNVTIDVGSLVVAPGGLVSTATLNRSSGNAGNLTIVADDSVHFGAHPDFPTDPASTLLGLISANTAGAGTAGVVTVLVETGSLVIAPRGVVAAAADPGSSGPAGTIELHAGSLVIAPGGVAYAGTQSSGKAGAIQVRAGSAYVGRHPDIPSFPGTFPGGHLHAGSAAAGDAGTIDVEAGSLVIAPEGSVFAGTEQVEGASGGGGAIEVHVGSLVIARGGAIVAWTGPESIRDAGTIAIDADSVHVGAHPDFPTEPESGLLGFINSGSAGAGTAGSIDIDTGSLLIAPGGLVIAQSESASSGDGGKILVRADSVHIGPHPDVPAPPGRLPLSIISTSTSGAGNAGTVDVQATQSIFLTYEGGLRFDLGEFLRQPPGTPSFNSGVFSTTVGGAGSGGTVKLSAPDVTITHGAFVATGTVGGGPGGDVFVNGSRILLAEGGQVNSVSRFNPEAGTAGGDAGSVTLEATESIAVVGRHLEFGLSLVHSNSLGSGAAGAVTLTAPRILIDGGVVATAALPDLEGPEGERGGEIALNARELLVREGGQVDASSFISGPAGSIDVRSSESIVVEGDGSQIASRTGGSGSGGDVRLDAPRIELRHGGEASARSEATGNAGTVTLVADEVLLDGGTIATNAESADGGDITIQAKKLVHLDTGVITASVTGGTGGNITIDPEFVILENESRIVAKAGAGSGGDIQITADNYIAFPGTVVDASSDLGIDGIVEVHTPDVDLVGKIATLPSNPLDASSLMREPCAARRSGERAGSFAVRGNGGIPPEPDGWLPASVAFEAALEPVATAGASAGAGSGAGILHSRCR